jgi:hypothetical protein
MSVARKRWRQDRDANGHNLENLPAPASPNEPVRLADLMAALPVTALRVIASGQTTIANLTTTTVATFTRNALERVGLQMFVTDNVAGVSWAEQGTVISMTTVVGRFEKTGGGSNEARLVIRNNEAVSSRTVDWLVLGIVP